MGNHENFWHEKWKIRIFWLLLINLPFHICPYNMHSFTAISINTYVDYMCNWFQQTLKCTKKLRHSHSKVELAVGLHLCAEDKISKLRKGEENDDKHDSKAEYVLGTRCHCRWQLRHCSVEADKLKQLNKKTTQVRKSRHRYIRTAYCILH